MNTSDVALLKGLKFVHLNVRSLYKKIPEITYLYKDFDFILCSETWLDNRYTDSMIEIPEFVPFRLDRCNADPILLNEGLVPGRGGGVIIYVKNKWAKFLKIYKMGTKITVDYEIVTVLLDKPGLKHMMISCVYKPPTGNIESLITLLTTMLNQSDLVKRESWILGDFNVDSLKRNSAIMCSVKTFLKECGLRQLITKGTRLTSYGATCIDWIITNSDFIHTNDVLGDLLSDHFPIFCIRKKEREKIIREWKTIRQYKNYNEVVFCNILMEIDWNAYAVEMNVDIMWDTLLDKINEILTVMCPFKRVYVRSQKTPWITNDIIHYINERTKFIKLFRKTGSLHFFELSKFLRNKVNTLIRKAKSKYIQDNLFRNKENPKKFWRILRTVFNGEKGKAQDMEFIHPETQQRVIRENTANFLNDYFVNIGTAAHQPDINLFEGPLLNDFKFEEITLGEVTKLINEIDTTKDSCIEGVNSEILKHALKRIPEKLQLLFERSICSGVFPRKWAMGFVNILPKSGDLTNPGNWRPITQTCIPAKLLEKVIQTRLMKVLLENKYINDEQYGFVPGRSTQIAVMELTNDLYHAMNSNLVTGLLFLDVRKAFDSLNHQILTDKLRKIGIARSVLLWFDSYLNRKQILRHNGRTSNELTVLSGIPQGSILGPTLFIFYINAIFDKITDVKIKMFADDCVLYKSGNHWNDIRDPLQDMLDVYINWGSNHCLSLNADKTKCMIVANRGKLNAIVDPAPFNAGNRRIMFVKKFSYLGIVLDSEMLLEPLYKNVCRQVEQKLFMLRKIRRNINNFGAISLYKQMILPIFDYSGFLLLACNLGQKRELQRIQNSCIRSCLLYNRIEHITIDRLHREMRLVSLEQRRQVQCLSLMYRLSKKEVYVKRTNVHTRGNVKIKFKLMSRCSGKYLSSPLYRGSQLWDKLDKTTQDLPNVKLFSTSLVKNCRVYKDLLT